QDLEEFSQITSPKHIFRNPGRQQIRRSIITRNLNEFVSSTPLNSVRKSFHTALTLSPIESEEDDLIAWKTRQRSNCLQQQDDNSESENFKGKKTKITGVKGKSSNSKIIFENRSNLQNSVLATILQSSNTFEKSKNDAGGEKSRLLQSSNVSVSTSFPKRLSTYTQTSSPTPPSIVSKLRNCLTQTAANKGTQITDSLERYSAVVSSKSKRLCSKAAHPPSDEDNDVTLTNRNCNLKPKGFVDKSKKDSHSIRRSPGMSPPHITNLNVEACIEDSVDHYKTLDNPTILVTPARDQQDQSDGEGSWLSTLLNSYLGENMSDTSRFSEKVESNKGKELVVVLERLEDTVYKMVTKQKHKRTETPVRKNLHTDSNSIGLFSKSKNERSTKKNKSNISQNEQNILSVNLGEDILENSSPSCSVFTIQKEVLNSSKLGNQQNDDNCAINNDYQGFIQQHEPELENDIEFIQKNNTSKRKKIQKPRKSLHDVANHLMSSKLAEQDTRDVSETQGDNCLHLEALDISQPVKRPKINVLDNHMLNSNACTDKRNKKERIRRPNNPVPEVHVTECSQAVSEDGLRRSKRQRKPKEAGYIPGYILTSNHRYLEFSKQLSLEDMEMNSRFASKFGLSVGKDSISGSKTSARKTPDKKRKVNNVKSNSKPKKGNEMTTGSRNRKNTSKTTSECNSEPYRENNLINDVIMEEINEDTETIPNIDYVNNSQTSEVATDLATDLGRSLLREAEFHSNSVLRDYFYFPHNNTVRRVAWCFVDPPLNAIDEGQGLRIAVGPKSSQAGFQSGLLEIRPGESKPKEMAVKFSLIFVVLEGNGLFEVHDSYRIVGHSAVLYVPLGAYYSIVNRSQTERLLLHYVQIKPHS
ncbi:hypothetical protein AMK59_688, partial [Oryctes borbonicus]